MTSIIRTKLVELDSIPAVAYKKKLANKRLERQKRETGNAAISITRTDSGANAQVSLTRRGDWQAPKKGRGADWDLQKVDELFPEEAIQEAVDLLAGMPYSGRGSVKVELVKLTPEDEEVQVDPEDKLPYRDHEGEFVDDFDATDSREYAAILDEYTRKDGKLDFQRMNKDFIQFAARSTVASNLISEGAPKEDILLFVLKNRAMQLAGAKEMLDDARLQGLVDSLDEIEPRSAFKELRLWIRKSLSDVAFAKKMAEHGAVSVV